MSSFTRATIALSVCIWALPPPARGQDLGLDLSEPPPETTEVEAPPAPPPPAADSLGLDLSAEPDARDFRPALAFLGLMGDVDAPELERIAELLQMAADGSGLFSRILAPGEVRELAGELSAGCREPGCFEATAEKLQVERLLSGELSGTTLTVFGYDRGTRQVSAIELPAERKLTGKKLSSGLAETFGALGAELASLKVAVNVKDATLSLNDRELGIGDQERLIAAGTYRLKVSARDHLPQEHEVVLQSRESLNLPVELDPAPPEPAPDFAPPPAPVAKTEQTTEGGGEIYNRPGFYLALVGVVAMGIGAGMGASAKSTERRATDANGDGVLDVTRRDILSAQAAAQRANLMLASGAALTAGGVVWILLTPSPAPASPTAGGGVSVGLAYGGSF